MMRTVDEEEENNNPAQHLPENNNPGQHLPENNNPGQQLPDEIIFHILSFLPLSSFFRFKLVCKLWNTLFLHPYLAYHHFRNSGYFDLDDVDDDEIESDEDPFYAIIGNSSQGLRLEQQEDTPYDNAFSIYRIHCPVFHQRLSIPNPQNPSLCITLEFVPSRDQAAGAVKLVSVHENDQNQYSLGYEILTLGIGSHQTTYCWRAVKVRPSNLLNKEQDGRKKKKIQLFFRMGVAYCLWYVETPDDDLDIEVDVLDMVNESYIGHTTFPKGVFSKLSSTNLLDWNGRLSFAQLVKDELHVLVLDNYEDLKWAERKRILKLTFLKPNHKELILFPTFAGNSKLFFVSRDKKSFCTYDINTRELQTTTTQACSFEGVAELAALIMFLLGINGQA